MRRTCAILLLVLTLTCGAAWAVPDGIWKDSEISPTYNFYVQTYDEASMVVIVSRGADEFWVFMDTNFSDGFSANEDISGANHRLTIVFSDDDSAVAKLTFDGAAAETYAITRTGTAPYPTTEVEGTPPSGSVTPPGSPVKGVITLEGAAEDDVGIDHVGIKCGDAQEVEASFNKYAGTFSYVWDTTFEANGGLTLKINAYDVEGLSSTIACLTVEVDNTSKQVSLLLPADGDVVYPPFNLDWLTISDAVRYVVQVAEDEAFANLIVNREWSIPPYTFADSSLFEGTGPYYWRVRAVLDSDEITPWSEARKFCASGSCGSGGGDELAQVTLITPDDGASVSVPVKMIWSQVENASAYEIKVCLDAQCGFVTLDQDDWLHPSMTFYATSGVEYYWKARAKYADGQAGPWSEVRTYTTQ